MDKNNNAKWVVDVEAGGPVFPSLKALYESAKCCFCLFCYFYFHSFSGCSPLAP